MLHSTVEVLPIEAYNLGNLDPFIIRVSCRLDCQHCISKLFRLTVSLFLGLKNNQIFSYLVEIDKRE